MDGDDNKLTLTKYENGRSVYKLADNGDEYWIYPNGNRKAYASADRSYIVMYDEQERWIGCRSKEGYNCVYRYPNSSVKAKGKEDAMGNRIGKWYLYSETGRLSVEENGVVRKPTKEEKSEPRKLFAGVGRCQTLTGIPLTVNTVAIFGLRRFLILHPNNELIYGTNDASTNHPYHG